MIASVLTIAIAIALLTIFSVLMEGIRGKIKARLQQRIGGSIVHEIHDILDLLTLKGITPEELPIYVVAPYFAFSLSLALGLSVPFGKIVIVSGNMLTIILLVLSITAIISIPAMLVNNVYSNIGANREIIITFTALIPFMLVCGIFLVKFNTLSIVEIAESLLVTPSVILGLAVIGYVVYVLSEFAPFDISRSNTEIIDGIFSEYGGRFLGILEWAFFIKRFSLVMFFSSLLAIPITKGILGVSTYGGHVLAFAFQLVFLTLYYIIATLIEERTARTRINNVIKVNGVVTLVAFLGLILSLFGL
ncbi:MAG: hypothetical protein DRN30_00465 [Thermoplasmata archaeon]|nr:NADH-quinone oxidoreductase subunit H [Euryarchaeota archaeon]RLF67220.1 MAG: hypothetical protein DRN30_00465 [Thermoplasmata archaeon]